MYEEGEAEDEQEGGDSSDGSGDGGGDGGDAAAHTPSSSTLAFHGSQALTPPPTRPPAPSARTLTRIPPAPVPACLPLPPALRSPLALRALLPPGALTSGARKTPSWPRNWANSSFF